MVESTKKSTVILAVVAVIVLTVSVMVFKKSSPEIKEPKKSALTLDLEKFKTTDPALIRYRELEPMAVNVKKLLALAVASDDTIYVSGDNTLLTLDAAGRELSRITLPAPAKCIAAAPDKTIYLGAARQVTVYNADGSKKASWEPLDARAVITSIAVTKTDVYVADAGNRVVLHYDTSGKLLNRMAEKNEAKEIPGLIVPSPYLDLAVGYEGYVWVVNPGRHSLENYTPQGDLRSSWTRSATTIEGFCGCCNPIHIAMLKDGSFVTSEKGLPRVKIHDQSGEFAAVVAGPEHFNEGSTGLDLAVTNVGDILVLDPSRGVIRVFRKKTKKKSS